MSHLAHGETGGNVKTLVVGPSKNNYLCVCFCEYNSIVLTCLEQEDHVAEVDPLDLRDGVLLQLVLVGPRRVQSLKGFIWNTPLKFTQVGISFFIFLYGISAGELLILLSNISVLWSCGSGNSWPPGSRQGKISESRRPK